MLNVNNKDVVVPGEVLAKGMEYLPSHGTYRNGEEIRAQMVGLVSIDKKIIKLVPLSGPYNPKKGDMIIGQVTDILFSGWRINIGTTNQAMLPLQEATSSYIERGENLTNYYNLDDWVSCSITNVTSQKLLDISMKGPGLKKLIGGRVISVNSFKVPRIIGKAGSMLNLIKGKTGSQILVGQNGKVWVKNDDPLKEIKAIEAIQFIAENAHIKGLTEKVEAFLG